jgi:hypothetical protein
MPANAPKVLLRSEQSGGALLVIELTGHAAPGLRAERCRLAKLARRYTSANEDR